MIGQPIRQVVNKSRLVTDHSVSTTSDEGETESEPRQQHMVFGHDRPCNHPTLSNSTHHTGTTPLAVSTWRFVSCPQRWRLVGRSLNTGVNTGLLSASNAPRITEGGRGGRRRSFEAPYSSFSLASFYPTYFSSFPSPLSPHLLPPFLCLFCLSRKPLQPPSSFHLRLFSRL